MDDAAHVPVLLNEACLALAVRDHRLYLDATFGGGGYSRRLLELNPTCQVLGLDRDLEAVERGAALARDEPRFRMAHGRFGDLAGVLAGLGVREVDGIVADIGLSTFQLEQGERGFSFMKEGPLDMRMDQSAGETAAELVHRLEAGELARLLHEYGDEPDARRVARAIVERRAHARIATTGQLRDVVWSVKRRRGDRIDPATQTFQALRIAVNDELGELERLLASSEDLLADGGRLAIVSFHSGEDRLVKRFIDARSGRDPLLSRHLPPRDIARPRFCWVKRSVTRPAQDELDANPRARSARLRVAERLPRAEDEESEEPSSWGVAA